MTWIIRAVIRAYWILIPLELRRRCLYKESCSRHVFAQADEGWRAALTALVQRFRTCRPGSVPLEMVDADGMPLVMVADGSVVRADQLR